MNTKNKKGFAHVRRGFGLIEIVVAAGIISIALFSLVATSQVALSVVSESVLREQAGFLSEEGVEAVKILRDAGWTSNISPLISGTTYYPVFSGGAWSLVTSDPGAIDGVFTRTVTLGDVYRKNSDDDIVDVSAPDPKTLDGGTRLATTTVSWAGGNPVSLSTYITDIFQN